MARVRTVDFLPEIFQTSTNRQFLGATLDQLVQEPRFKKIQGFVGRRVGPGVNPNENYVVEPTAERANYQLEPGVIIEDPDSSKIKDAITYPGILDALALQGGLVNNADRLFTSDYYSWDPFVDFDKFVNFNQYYWLPAGPDAVDVFAETVPSTDSFTVNRSNGTYTFSGVPGTNPTLTLVRGGSYTFDVAQNQKETINYRVTNSGVSAYVINFEANPTLTLVRGNTYVFDLVLTGNLPFYIKTLPAVGINNLYNDGVSNNGASEGLITFVVPQDAPDTLYYANSTQPNMQGVFNIVNATPGTGPGFWIQTDPGVNGRIPSTPNISSRDVLGVSNNGEDLGTITFNVPLVDAQNFYYDLTSIGTVDLITDLQFNQINNQPLTTFLEQYGGIDGITMLNGLTLVFQSTNTGWEQTIIGNGFGDMFDQTTEVPEEDRYNLWRININNIDGTDYIQLSQVSTINELEKFTIIYGTQYSSTQWYKNTEAVIVQIPLLTAAKDILYYQDGVNPDLFGVIKLINQDQANTLDVDDIIGRKNYTSPNGVVFTNGLKVQFIGSVSPASYQNNSYYVEGVGTAIKLLPVSNFVTPETYTQSFTVPYDSTPYDVGNFDASLNQPIIPDYLTINRASPDLNAWTRSNRWFHIDVINATAEYNNTVAVLDNNFRAKRPILEFRAGTKLYNMGTQGKQPVNIIDFETTDALSTINGTTSYSIDGYNFINGTRVIFAADTDPQVRNKIYEVEFITPDSVSPLIAQPIINLVPAADSTVLINQSVVVLSGIVQQGLSYWYDGVEWTLAQEKSKTNQAPLFDVYDLDGISFGNRAKYPSTNFTGSKLFSYATGNGNNDTVLGFPIRYLSLANVGDIVFENNLYTDTFIYTRDSVSSTENISQGIVREYQDRTVFVKQIGWQNAATPSITRQQFRFTYNGQPLQLDVKVLEDNVVPSVQLYVGGKFQDPSTYIVQTTDESTTITLTKTFVDGDVIEVDVISDQVSKVGFYQVPENLENNPLNVNSPRFTLGTVRSHYESIGENLINLQGPINGANNTRDLGNLVPFGTNILQQSSPLTLAGYFMRSADYNIFAALTYNSREYEKFKAQLLDNVIRNDYTNYTIPDMLTAVITDITVGRTELNPFYWSDMLPASSVYTETTTVYTPISVPVFDLTTTYDFTSSNYKGLLVYVNDVLLTIGYDYVVSTDGPRLTITRALVPGDVITIQEYATTYGSFVPNTPTKLGLYPAFKPQIYLDTTYVTPTLVIQGHDGSKTIAFGDFRDQLLLEFETRIYNNLKIKSPIPLTAFDVIPGQFRTTDYSLAEINQILAPDFLSWVGWNKLDYKTQNYNANNEFTWNYSASGNKLSAESPIDETPLPVGAWRGIYRYFYDTDYPNTRPWEMLGFTEEPTWWQDLYGPAPYTNGNEVLWDDLAQGRVADPAGEYFLPQFARPELSQVVPAGSEGELLSPFETVVGLFDSSQFQKSWTFGDGGPVEATWFKSSSYPFAIMRLLALTRPAEFFSLFADRDLYKFDDELDQYLYNQRYRLDANGIEIYGNGVSKASYIDWIIDYNQQLGRDSSTRLETDLQNIDVRLCYRVGSFTDKQYTKIFTEKSSPESLNSSLLLPDESYSLMLYKNQPFDRIIYSSVIIQIVEDGYAVYGYSITNPYFNILTSRVSGTKTILDAGGTSVSVPNQYTDNVVQVPYGYVFTNETAVCDFLLSYGALLTSQGLVFDGRENGRALNWNQMAQEFLYWANQGWGVGTVINLNPGAVTITAIRPLAIVDSVVAQTPENLILDQNRLTLPIRDLVVDRYENTFKLYSLSNQTISYLDLRFTNYESLIVLDNVSIFNDLIYDPATGARQSRINISAAVSAEWNGQLDAQGFILNNQSTIENWQPNRKYAKGEIVIYKNNYWSAQTIVQPSVEFDYNNWVKSDYTKIQRGLLENIPNKADQLANSYNTNTANLETDQDLLSYGLIGFRPRQYMSALNLDDVSQVNVYQQFLKTKGTIQSVRLLGNANLGKEVAEYDVFENWAIQRATYGANANRSFIELRLNEALLDSDPSLVQVIQPQQSSDADQAILLQDVWRESYKLPNTNIFPTTTETINDSALPTAGYVNLDDVDITVFSLLAPLSITPQVLDTVGVGTTIWAAKSNSHDWNIYRCNSVPGRIISISSNLNTTSLVEFSVPHGLVVGDIIIVRFVNDVVNGVYRVLATPDVNSVVIELSLVNNTTIESQGLAYRLQTMRVAQASDVANLPYSTDLLPGARAWVDNDGAGLWEVIEKQSPFVGSTALEAQDPAVDSLFGSSVAQGQNNIIALVGSPGYSTTGAVYPYLRSDINTYVESTLLTLGSTDTAGYGNAVDIGNQVWCIAGASQSNSGTGYASVIYRADNANAFEIRQLLIAPDTPNDANEFGYSVCVSRDERWMYVGAPAGDKVYAYGRVDLQDQFVQYTTDGVTFAYNYFQDIVINNDEQLSVVLNNQLLTYGVDYTVNINSVLLNNAPAAGLKLVITRKTSQNYTGDGSTDVFNVSDYLYTAADAFAITVRVDSVLQRPYLDYTYDGTDITFVSAPADQTTITVNSKTYYTMVDVLTVAGLPGGARFGQSVATTTDGRQVAIGCPNNDYDGMTDVGTVYVFDRSVEQIIITDPDQTSYALPAGYQEPVSVLLNNEFLTNADNFLDGQFTVSGGNVVLSDNVELSVGDVLQIEGNIFTQVQNIPANSPFESGDFGASVDVCPNNCSLYIGSPLDGSVVPQGGSVDRRVNQSRVYGVITSTVANPSLVAGDTIRIQNISVAVPDSPDNTVSGLAQAIIDADIPNITASVNNGLLTISVVNAEAADQFNRLSVLPGLTGTAFANLGFEVYAYTQTITSPYPVSSAKFGTSLNIDTESDNLVVGAPGGTLYQPVTFDSGKTYFDDQSTVFNSTVVQSGAVYTFDYLDSASDSISNPGKFVFGQQVYDNNIKQLDQWGASVNYTGGKLLIGSPGSDVDDSTYSELNYGRVGVFLNPDRKRAWTVIHQQRPVANVQLFNSVYMYDILQSPETHFFDFINPLQGKILGAARQNIDYINIVDPAKYNTGTVNNNGNFWGEDHVGEIWWDINRTRFIDPNQDDITYASRRWGQLFPGSSVDIYQWVESTVPPALYAGPGTPYSTTSFTVNSRLTQDGIFATLYYFWVTGIDTIATTQGKTLSTTGIARYIESPRSSGIPYIAPLNANTIAIYNGLQFISAQDTVIHIEYDREYTDDNIHTEFDLITQDRPDSFLSNGLYRKLQDSFCGVNTVGAKVPDTLLSPPERYGVQFRPRQSMFVDRFAALENYLGRANDVLKNFPIVETRKFTLLNSQEPEPTAASGEWNKRLATIEELSYQNIDAVPLGYKYLIVSDSTNNGLWTIYQVILDSTLIGSPRTTQLVRVQTYDTRKYWFHIDWYQPGYNSSVIPVAEVPNYATLETLTNISVGDSVKVTRNAQGKFEIYQRTETGWNRVGLEDGTIQFSSVLWNYIEGKFGFDAEVFDSQYFDQEPTIETRNIIQAINEELFIDDLAIERNRALILMFEFILSELESPEWLMKTSLIDVEHRIRELIPFQIYRQDNQEFVLDYIQEVKPYHVQIKEFNLAYNGQDLYDGMMTDFDVPAYYNTSLEIPKYVSPILLPYTTSTAVGTGTPNSDSDTPSNAEIWDQTPWSDWYNNYLLSVQDVSVYAGGSGYTVPPSVIVTGDCTVPAEITAIINSAGQVIGVNIVNPGSGYALTPTITFVGGNGSGAKGYAVLGNNLIRSFKTTIKYDRYQYNSDIVDWEANVNYDNGTQVRYQGEVWAADSQDSTSVQSATFNPEEWVRVPASTLSGVNRTQGFYAPGPNEPGLDLPLLIDGLDYPGVQVMGPLFSQNTGFDVGNYDINPFDNISFGPEGLPTYDPGILDAIYENIYTNPYFGTLPAPAYNGNPPTPEYGVVVDGGGYVDTYSSHAPEELIPGAEFDTLDLRVYTRPGADWDLNGHGFAMKMVKYQVENFDQALSFSGLEPDTAVIQVSNQTRGVDLYLDLDYTVNWINQTITIIGNTSIGDIIVISAYEVGGGNQLLQTTVSGENIGNSYTVEVAFDEIQEMAIFVNGLLITDYTYEALGTRQTEITFDQTYTDQDYLAIFVLGPTTIDGETINYSWSTPLTQYITADGSTLTFDLDNSMEYTNPVNLVVTVNGVRARTASCVEHIADGSTAYLLPDRLGFSQELISDNEVFVYVDGYPKILGVDYNVEPYAPGDLRSVEFVEQPEVGSKIIIAVTTNTQCWVNSNQLVFNPTQGLIPVLGDTIAVTSWNDTRQQDILTKVFVGPTTTGVEVVEAYDETDYDEGNITGAPGSFDYSVGTTVSVNDIQLGRTILDPSRLWVTLNGRRIFFGAGFIISGQELILTSGIMSPTDILMITEFTDSTVPEAMAFRIFQDMRGVQAVYRITPATTTQLTQELLSTDDIIYVANVQALDQPDVENNIWGIITINGERIMYRQRDVQANTVSGLLRGTAGTAAADHAVDSLVYDMGRGNLLPEQYQNYVIDVPATGDGSTVVFTAPGITTTLSLEDAVEVYVGGIKQVAGYTLTSVAPVVVEFDTAPEQGVQVDIVIRRGVTWYNPGAGTPSNGVALQDTDNRAARFLRGLQN